MLEREIRETKREVYSSMEREIKSLKEEWAKQMEEAEIRVRGLRKAESWRSNLSS